MGKKIIIIGGGIAGLTAGIYGQMNGYDTEIYEMHSIAGGVCTAWKRKDYTFEGCIHWLTGSSPDDIYHKYWQEVGAFDDNHSIEYDEYTRLYESNGDEFIMYTDINTLTDEMKKISQEDSGLLDELKRASLHISGMPIFEMLPDAMGFFDFFTMIKAYKPFMKDLKKYFKMPISTYIKQYKSQELQTWLGKLMPDKRMSVGVLMYLLGVLHKKSAGWPIGGSLKFVDSMMKKYLRLGGTIHYNKRVTNILTQKKRAYAIRLDDGQEINGDYIISACDGHSTIFDMLDGKFINKKIRSLYNEMPLFTPFIQVSLGVKKDLSDLPHSRSYFLKEPIWLGKTKTDALFIRHYCYDKTMAPEGKSAVTILIETPWAQWENMTYNSDAYKEEKRAIEQGIMDYLHNEMPELATNVEVIDIATPFTTIRYTGNWKASYEGFLPNATHFGLRIKKTLPGLKQFFMIGQWTTPGGGLPSALFDGRGIIHLLCKKDKKKFIADTK